MYLQREVTQEFLLRWHAWCCWMFHAGHALLLQCVLGNVVQEESSPMWGEGEGLRRVGASFIVGTAAFQKQQLNVELMQKETKYRSCTFSRWWCFVQQNENVVICVVSRMKTDVGFSCGIDWKLYTYSHLQPEHETDLCISLAEERKS